MAQITDFETLQTEIIGWTHRTGDTDFALLVPGFIQFGENRIYRDLRVKQMEASLSGTIASGVVAVPSGYLEAKYLYVTGSPGTKLQRKDAEWIYQNYPTRSAQGMPKFFAREASNLIFGPYPDAAYSVSGLYYRRQPALSDTNETNWLIDDCPELLLFASLCEAAPWMEGDERVALWEKKYAQIRDRMQSNDEQEEFSGSPLQVTTR